MYTAGFAVTVGCAAFTGAFGSGMASLLDDYVG